MQQLACGAAANSITALNHATSTTNPLLQPQTHSLHAQGQLRLQGHYHTDKRLSSRAARLGHSYVGDCSAPAEGNSKSVNTPSHASSTPELCPRLGDLLQTSAAGKAPLTLWDT